MSDCQRCGLYIYAVITRLKQFQLARNSENSSRNRYYQQTTLYAILRSSATLSNCKQQSNQTSSLSVSVVRQTSITMQSMLSNIGTARSSMECDAEHLISLVEKRRAIYDVTSKEYNNRSIVDKMWQEIADETGKSGKHKNVYCNGTSKIRIGSLNAFLFYSQFCL